MKEIIILAILFSVTNLYSATYYVNGIKGNDTLKTHTGQTESKAFKTINKAISVAKRGDIIKVKGKVDTIQIIYKESVYIPFDKEELKIIGENSPIIDGKFGEEEVPYYGFLIKGRGTVIEGLTIRNFTGGKVNEFGLAGSAAIILDRTNTCIIINNKIENCNWGIIAIESEFCSIQGNSFYKISSVSDDFNLKSGGVALYLKNNEVTMQKYLIGNEKGNVIDDATLYGIWFGTELEHILADLTLIENNIISRVRFGPALFIRNLEGTVRITKNTFRHNHHSLEIEGMCIDTWIAENIFAGSNSAYEIKTDERYAGSLIFDIWRSNKNEFYKTTYGLIERRNNIRSVNNYRYIWNNKEEVENHKSNYIIEELAGTKNIEN